MTLNLRDPLGRRKRGCSRAVCKENRGARPPSSWCKVQIKSNSRGGSNPRSLIALRGSARSVSHGGGELRRCPHPKCRGPACPLSSYRGRGPSRAATPGWFLGCPRGLRGLESRSVLLALQPDPRVPLGDEILQPPRGFPQAKSEYEHLNIFLFF